jgi:hypothetical protein
MTGPDSGTCDATSEHATDGIASRTGAESLFTQGDEGQDQAWRDVCKPSAPGSAMKETAC